MKIIVNKKTGELLGEVNWVRDNYILNEDEIENLPEISEEEKTEMENPYPFWYETHNGYKRVDSYQEEMEVDREESQYYEYLANKSRTGRPRKYKTEGERKKAHNRYMLNKEWRCEKCNNHNYTLAGKHTHLKTIKYKQTL